MSADGRSKRQKPGEKPEKRLAREKSPYLLQHARNPVDWYPWGDAAFEAAVRQDKPVFLSIGYSTCHWCHVMERESFEDPEVAGLLNETFVPVKVDREERPDIDDVYMTVCQMLTGNGGWPLTILMTPDKRPFFAATYLPKRGNPYRMGLVELTLRVQELWKHDRDSLAGTASKVTSALRQISTPPAGARPEADLLKRGFEELRARFDPVFGGFGQRMKFPSPHQLIFLLRYWKRSGDADALGMVETTLAAMRNGGIFDHVGFGFHRYATDRQWVVPHFEKMLYDQALIAMAYTEAYQATRIREYARTARLVFDYVLRDLRSPEGAFYCAEDADSEGEEGRFYVWTEPEIRQLLDPEQADLVTRVFQVHPEGNFKDEATGRPTGYNILHTRTGLDGWARELARSLPDLERGLEQGLSTLFAARARRPRPMLDDKILTDWNGLMVAALATAARAFKDLELAQAAERTADFVLRNLRTEDGRLLHRFRDGQGAIPAYLDDYAFLAWGLAELYRTVRAPRYLELALELVDQMLNHHWDDTSSGFFLTADDGEKLLVRRKEAYDGAVPSGNSAAAYVLILLARLTGRNELEEKALETQRAFAGIAAQAPSQHAFFLCSVDLAAGPAREVVVVGRPDASDTRDMLTALDTGHFPDVVALFKPTTQEPADTGHLPSFTEQMHAVDGRATAYVCRERACRLPVTEVAAMLAQLSD